MKWKTMRLGDVLTLKRGHDLPSDTRHEGEVPVVSSAGITGFHNVAAASAPGVVTGRYGTIGEVYYLECDYWPLNTALYVVDFKGAHPRFAAYFLRNLLKDYKSEKAAVPGVDRNVLHEFQVKVPRRDIQEQIAAILSTYDDLIENNRRRMALLEKAARQLYDEWFVRLRFPGHERTRTVKGLPTHWCRLLIREVCMEDGGIQTGPFGSQLHQSDYTDEGVPVVMPKDLAKYPIDTSSIARIPEDLADRLGRHRMEVGDVVYGRRGDIGRRGYITPRQAGWFCGTGCLRLRPDRSKIVPRFFFDALGAPDTAGTIAARAQGATMPNLNTTILGSAEVLVPPLNIQQLYVDEIDPMFEMIETLDAQSTKLAQARDLLLPRLMSGEIEV